jgi:hypothetical protein
VVSGSDKLTRRSTKGEGSNIRREKGFDRSCAVVVHADQVRVDAQPLDTAIKDEDLVEQAAEWVKS